MNSLCLNIGCWLDVAEGWENIDASPYVKISKIPVIGPRFLSAIGAPNFPKSIKYGDLLKGININHESCELIFASHVLEHLSLSDFNLALNNIYLYLQPGGILRIIVPDLEQYIKEYMNLRSDSARATQAAYRFMKASCIGQIGSRKDFFQRCKEILSNSRHQWMWDEPSLSEALVKHGFKNIRRCDYGDWSDPRFKSVEKENRHWQSICLEATK